MLFRDVQAVLEGRKTQTRRVKGRGEYMDTVGGVKTVFTEFARVKWQVGRMYAVVPGMGKEGVGHFMLLDIREERVQDISYADALAEGCPDEGLHAVRPPVFDACCSVVLRGFLGPLAWFADLWDDIFKRRKDLQFAANPEVWALTIEVCDGL